VLLIVQNVHAAVLTYQSHRGLVDPFECVFVIV